MSAKKPIIVSEPSMAHGSFRTYKIGYIASLIITIAAYLIVSHHLFNRKLLIGTVAVLAISQFIVQLIYFLHLGQETKPRWKLMVFGFMVMVVLLVVFGSIWIMTNLNYHMTPEQMNRYLQSQDGL